MELFWRFANCGLAKASGLARLQSAGIDIAIFRSMNWSRNCNLIKLLHNTYDYTNLLLHCKRWWVDMSDICIPGRCSSKSVIWLISRVTGQGLVGLKRTSDQGALQPFHSAVSSITWSPRKEFLGFPFSVPFTPPLGVDGTEFSADSCPPVCTSQHQQ